MSSTSSAMVSGSKKAAKSVASSSFVSASKLPLKQVASIRAINPGSYSVSADLKVKKNADGYTTVTAWINVPRAQSREFVLEGVLPYPLVPSYVPKMKMMSREGDREVMVHEYPQFTNLNAAIELVRDAPALMELFSKLNKDLEHLKDAIYSAAYCDSDEDFSSFPALELSYAINEAGSLRIYADVPGFGDRIVKCYMRTKDDKLYIDSCVFKPDIVPSGKRDVKPTEFALIPVSDDGVPAEPKKIVPLRADGSLFNADSPLLLKDGSPLFRRIGPQDLPRDASVEAVVDPQRIVVTFDKDMKVVSTRIQIRVNKITFEYDPSTTGKAADKPLEESEMLDALEFAYKMAGTGTGAAAQTTDVESEVAVAPAPAPADVLKTPSTKTKPVEPMAPTKKPKFSPTSVPQ